MIKEQINNKSNSIIKSLKKMFNIDQSNNAKSS